jgi:DNA-binding NtrC family response regulator
VEKGLFREDLFYRLNVFPIHLPPLRERREDIAPLVMHLIEKHNGRARKKISGLKPDAMRMVMDYCWPGNVRELENAVEHAFVTCGQGEIDPLDLPLEIRRTDVKDRICGKQRAPIPEAPAPKRSRRAGTKEELLALLTDCKWNKAEVARRLGITRTQVWRRMTQMGIPLDPKE